MEKEQFEEKVLGLARQAQVDMLADCLRLYESGAVEPDNWEDNYELPRVIFRIALEREAEQTAPGRWMSGSRRYAYENLKNF